MPITVLPVTPAIGAELRGVDLREPLDEAAFGAIRDALMAHQVLCGSQPAEGNSLRERIRHLSQMCAEVPPFGEPVPLRWHSALLQGLEFSPAERYPSMTQLISALKRDSRRSKVRQTNPGLAPHAAGA